MNKKLLLTLTSSAFVLMLSACGENSDEKEDVNAESSETQQETKTNNIHDLKPSKVRNDTTGNFKKVTTNGEIKIPEDAIKYYNEHMTDDEVHYIIDFSKNTTTNINEMAGILFVTVYEYQEKEEHDANTIGNGELLKEYHIDIDSGEIEEI